MQLPANIAFVELQAPADLNGGVAASYFSMKNFGRVSIVVNLGAISSLADTITLTLYEATAVAGTGAQTLAIPRCYSYDATTDIYTAVTVETDGTVDCDVSTVYFIDVDESELSANDNYDCLGLALSDPGEAASYGCVFAICNNMKQLATTLTD